MVVSNRTLMTCVYWGQRDVYVTERVISPGDTEHEKLTQAHSINPFRRHVSTFREANIEEFDALEQNMLHSQKQLTQEELSKINHGLYSGDSYSFRKKRNDEKDNINCKVLDKLKEARGHSNPLPVVRLPSLLRNWLKV